DHRTGNIGLLHLPIARANLDLAFGPNRAARNGLVSHLTGFDFRAATGDGDRSDVLLVNRPVSAIVDRHLVILPNLPLNRVMSFLDMLLIKGAVGGVPD